VFDVRPEVLRQAAADFSRAADFDGKGAERLLTSDLDEKALGITQAAQEFTAAFQEFVITQSNDLRNGAMWFQEASDGLIATADIYSHAEHYAIDELDLILQRLGGK
jgi:hypothetical protein